MKYYIEEIRYHGPNAADAAYIDFDRFEITTEPTRTNRTHEICLDGWLGTYNDVSRYAHGVYDSLAAAEYATRNLLGDLYRRDDEPSESPDVVAVYRSGRLAPITDDGLAGWLQDVDVPADTDDARLKRLAFGLALDLADEGMSALPYRIQECLESLRDDAREELED